MIKTNDFIEIDYTGRFADGNEVFDTTKITVAKENNLFEEGSEAKFVPLILCVGHGQVIKGLDKALIGKKLDEEFKIEVSAEEGFGKKDAKLISLVSANEFKKQKVNPMVGMAVNIDDSMGIIRSVSGGRVVVDFNHPFSSKDLIYEVKILKIIEDNATKVKLLTKSFFNIESEVEIKENKAEVKFKLPANVPKESLNDEIKKVFADKIKEIVGIEANISL